MAVALLLFLWLTYTLLLLVGQWLYNFNFDIHIVKFLLVKLKPLCDAHYAAFKPRHHYWFGLLLTTRAAILLMSAVIPSDHGKVLVLLITVLSVLLIFWGQQVHHNCAVSIFSTTFFMNLTFLSLTRLFSYDTTFVKVSFNTLTGIALLQFMGLILYRLVLIAKRNRRMMAFFTFKRQEETSEDDMELFEMAEFERGIESDSDEDENIGNGDMNLPTY